MFDWTTVVALTVTGYMVFRIGWVFGWLKGRQIGREAGLRRGARALREIAGTMTEADAIGGAHATAQILDNIADCERSMPGQLIEYEEGRVWI